jgi:hypothetical protein
MRMHKAEVALCASLATKLRLTPRSTVDKTKPKLASAYAKPWEDDPPAA